MVPVDSFKKVKFALSTVMRIYVAGSSIILVSIAVPLAIYYRSPHGLVLKNTLKIIALLVVLKIVFEFVWYQLFTGIFFQLMRLPFLSWVDILLHDGSLMLVVIYIYDRYLGRHISVSPETSTIGLKQYLREFIKMPVISPEVIDSESEESNP